MARTTIALTTLVLLLCAPAIARAHEADVTDVQIRYRGFSGYDFTVTVRHEEQTYGHFVDRWEIVTSDGRTLASKQFSGPHAGGPSFTETLFGVSIPPEVDRVTVRAHDTVHAFGGRTVTVQVPKWDGHGKGMGGPLP